MLTFASAPSSELSQASLETGALALAANALGAPVKGCGSNRWPMPQAFCVWPRQVFATLSHAKQLKSSDVLGPAIPHLQKRRQLGDE